MKYPWVSISILTVWFSTTAILIARNDTPVEYILGLSLFSTIFLVAVGFRSPR